MNHCCSAEQLKVKKFLFDSQCESEEYSSETGPHHNMWSSHSLQPFKLTSHNNQLQQSSSRGTVKLQGNPVFCVTLVLKMWTQILMNLPAHDQVNIYKQNISAPDVGRGIFKRESPVIVGMIDSGAGAGHMCDV